MLRGNLDFIPNIEIDLPLVFIRLGQVLSLCTSYILSGDFPSIIYPYKHRLSFVSV